MEDYIIRFFVGGLAVSAFALLGDIFKPKSLAGLFGAAPSIALATLGLTIWKQGTEYAATETTAMILGAIALAVYSLSVCETISRLRFGALLATIVTLPIWFVVALGLKWLAFG